MIAGEGKRLVELLRIDTDLLDVAAGASPPMQLQSLTRKAIQKWLEGQQSDRKDEYLERFIAFSSISAMRPHRESTSRVS